MTLKRHIVKIAMTGNSNDCLANKIAKRAAIVVVLYCKEICIGKYISEVYKKLYEMRKGKFSEG